MGKIHELLAVEQDVKRKGEKTAAEVKTLFQAGDNVFVGQHRTYEPKIDGGDRYPDEVKTLGGNVRDQLQRVQQDFGRWLDLAVSKEASNAQPEAVSTFRINDKPVTLPVGALINLEKRLEELTALYNAIPVNSITDHWEYDTAQGVWMSDPVQTYKTKKVATRFVKAEATAQHAAQVEIISLDEREGTWTAVKTSGMLSPVEKAQRLARLEALLLEVRKARQRANDVEAEDYHIANDIFNYIEGK